MRRLITMALLAGTAASGLSAQRPSPAATAAKVATSQQDAAFAALAKAYLAEQARLHPGYATYLGNHAYDAEVEDLSAAGRARDAAFVARTLAGLQRIDRSRLSRDNQVDAALLLNDLQYRQWQANALQEWTWNPMDANEAISGGLYLLAARDFATWANRLRSATARMEKAPAMFAQMRANLVPALVPAIYAQTVAKQNGGILDIVDTMLAPHKGELNTADARRFDAAATRLRAAVAEQQHWLDTVLVPQAKGDFRLGAEKYDRKLAFALVTDRTRAQIKSDAQAAFDATRAEMYAVAREALAGRTGAPATPANPTPAQMQAAIEAALELSYAHRPARDGVMATATDTLRQATSFVRARNLVSVPDSPVQIIEMPKFRQGVAVAYCDSPGPLEQQLGTFYAISPIPADWSDARATSFLREYNDYMLHELSIHEAMPGHYLQIAHANANPSTLRAVLASGSFVEGWAVYAERLMAEAGYLDNDPLFRLTVMKMRLRSITNTLLDIGIHTEGMTSTLR